MYDGCFSALFPTSHSPVWMFLQGLDGLLNTADVPELDLTVVSAAGKIVLAVGVEIQVAHQLAMGILNAVNLTAQDRGGEREN